MMPLYMDLHRNVEGMPFKHSALHCLPKSQGSTTRLRSSRNFGRKDRENTKSRLVFGVEGKHLSISLHKEVKA